MQNSQLHGRSCCQGRTAGNGLRTGGTIDGHAQDVPRYAHGIDIPQSGIICYHRGEMAVAGHVVIAPDKFKGSLTAAAAAEAISVGLKRGAPTLAAMHRPVADGGDGTLDTVLAAGFARIPVYAKGPTGQVV